MSAAVFKSPDNRRWREFYNSAILEIDLTKLPERIAEAEKALVQHGLRSTCKRNLSMSERNREGLGHTKTGTW